MNGDIIKNRASGQAYSLYGAKLYNFAYYSTYSQEDAQDLTQEAFLRYARPVHGWGQPRTLDIVLRNINKCFRRLQHVQYPGADPIVPRGRPHRPTPRH